MTFVVILVAVIFNYTNSYHIVCNHAQRLQVICFTSSPASSQIEMRAHTDLPVQRARAPTRTCSPTHPADRKREVSGRANSRETREGDSEVSSCPDHRRIVSFNGKIKAGDSPGKAKCQRGYLKKTPDFLLQVFVFIQEFIQEAAARR